MSEKTYYEQPLTKPIRLFMRYEQLMDRFEVYSRSSSQHDTHSAITALLELYQLTLHINLKADVLREIDRMKQALGKMALSDEGILNSAEIESRQEKLLASGKIINSIHGQLNAHLKNHEFFNLVRQRMTMPGGVTSYDLAIYHHWLNRPEQYRQETLQNWIQPYALVNEIIAEILRQIRSYVLSEKYTAESGYFQHSFLQANSFQILRVWLPQNAEYYPEISAGRQRFSVRFFEPQGLTTRPGQTKKDIKFEVMYCGF